MNNANNRIESRIIMYMDHMMHGVFMSKDRTLIWTSTKFKVDSTNSGPVINPSLGEFLDDL